jgi:hypothetical protein
MLLMDVLSFGEQQGNRFNLSYFDVIRVCFTFCHAEHMKSLQLKLGFHSYASSSLLVRFQLRCEEDIEFNKLELRDNVAQLCVLEVCY